MKDYRAKARASHQAKLYRYGGSARDERSRQSGYILGHADPRIDDDHRPKVSDPMGDVAVPKVPLTYQLPHQFYPDPQKQPVSKPKIPKEKLPPEWFNRIAKKD